MIALDGLDGLLKKAESVGRYSAIVDVKELINKMQEENYSEDLHRLFKKLDRLIK